MFDELAEPSEDLCREGREIINQARSLEERKIARGEGTIGTNPAQVISQKTKLIDTSDFLARYKSNQSSNPAQISRTANEDEDRNALFKIKRKEEPLLPTTS